MNKARKAGAEIKAVEALAQGNSLVHRLSPLSKLAMALAYIIITVSFGKYDYSALIVMLLFPVIGYQLALIPIGTCFYKLRIVLPLVCAVGVFNPVFDREIMLRIGNVAVSGGVISMITLMMKGVFSLMMSFLLVSTTPVDELCRALRKIHFPKLLVSLLLLTFRYVSAMLDEVAVMTDAYHLRAPGQKGIHFSAWGTFLGQLILRSSDRANEIYSAMLLRGFTGDFDYSPPKKYSRLSPLIALILISLFIAARLFNVISLFGRLK